MAERRMFTKKVTDDDNFMSLSASAQALYLHLSMSADDDGFCNQVSTSMFKAHASIQDLEALLTKRYVYQFENGVIVIKHWRMANALRKDRYTPTAFQEELKQLKIKENGAYSLTNEALVAERLPDGCQMVATGKDRLGKDSVGKDRLGESTPPAPEKEQKHTYGEYKHVRLTDKEYNNLCQDFGDIQTADAIRYLDEYIEMKGTKYKSHNLALRKWVFDAVREKTQKKPVTEQSIAERWANVK